MEDNAPLASGDIGPVYREDDMGRTLSPDHYAHYRTLPVGDQVVLAHYVGAGLAYGDALIKLSKG